VGGTDINPEAVAQAKKNIPFAKDLEVGTAEDIFFSDKSIDVVITDATLIYVPYWKIKRTINELARVARNGVILCELYKENRLRRFFMWWKEKLYLHNYPKLLEQAGFYDIKITKITKKFWDNDLWYDYGFIISARI